MLGETAKDRVDGSMAVRACAAPPLSAAERALLAEALAKNSKRKK